MRTILLISINFWGVLFAEPHFKAVVLGCGGGPKETNISGYLVAPIESDQFIALDAGTLLAGIEHAVEKGAFNDIAFSETNKYDRTAQIFRSHIKAFLISHPHLDHTGGLVINSPLGTKNYIYGSDFTIDGIRDHLFNWIIWPNFGSEGKNPLHIYSYKRLEMKKWESIPGTNIEVKSFPLSHPNGYPSTAYLIRSGERYTLYFGDTSPDELENKHHIETIWEEISPLIRDEKLHSIFLECSYPDSHPTTKLWGHLKPKFFIEEINRLATRVNPQKPTLQSTKVIITHIKETFIKDEDAEIIIQHELEANNPFGISFIFPEPGMRLEL